MAIAAYHRAQARLYVKASVQGDVFAIVYDQDWIQGNFSSAIVTCGESIVGTVFRRSCESRVCHLSELCIPVSTSAGRHFLRSATYGDLLVPRTSTSTYGPRSFAVSGPRVWNKLPATLRISPTLGQFQSKLKAVLFRSAYET